MIGIYISTIGRFYADVNAPSPQSRHEWVLILNVPDIDAAMFVRAKCAHGSTNDYWLRTDLPVYPLPITNANIAALKQQLGDDYQTYLVWRRQQGQH